MAEVPSLSTDQVAAFVELARQGTLRGAAGVLHITEQGVRNRLVAQHPRAQPALEEAQDGPAAPARLCRRGGGGGNRRLAHGSSPGRGRRGANFRIKPRGSPRAKGKLDGLRRLGKPGGPVGGALRKTGLTCVRRCRCRAGEGPAG